MQFYYQLTRLDFNMASGVSKCVMRYHHLLVRAHNGYTSYDIYNLITVLLFLTSEGSKSQYYRPRIVNVTYGMTAAN